jgi:hypothetical protein
VASTLQLSDIENERIDAELRPVLHDLALSLRR